MHEDGRLRFVRAAIESVEFLGFLNNQIKRYLFFFKLFLVSYSGLIA